MSDMDSLSDDDISYLTDSVTKAPAGPSAGIMKNLMIPSMVISSAGSIATLLGQVRSAKAQGDYEQSIARTNTKLAEFQGKQVLEEGDIEASRERLKAELTQGAQRAAQGASGTDVNAGSNVLTRLSTENIGAMDELTIRNNAARRAWGYHTEAIQDTYKGQFARLTADAQVHQSILTGGLKAIEGPTSIYANYLRFSRWMQGGSGANTSVPFPEVTG